MPAHWGWLSLAGSYNNMRDRQTDKITLHLNRSGTSAHKHFRRAHSHLINTAQRQSVRGTKRPETRTRASLCANHIMHGIECMLYLCYTCAWFSPSSCVCVCVCGSYFIRGNLGARATSSSAQKQDSRARTQIERTRDLYTYTHARAHAHTHTHSSIHKA